MNDQIAENSQWKGLFWIGGIAPIITIVIYVSQVSISVLSGLTYPTTPESWFALFQQNTFLGLIFLNAFDVFSIAILGLMFLALYIALREINPSFMAMAAFFAFLGIAVFVSSRALMVSGTLNLSNLYATAITDMEKSQLQAAWLIITSPARATPETTGFLFTAIASLIISTVILQTKTFSKITAYVGIVGCVITFADQVSLVIVPAVAAILMPISGTIWLIWWILISRKLLQLGKGIRRTT